MRKDMKLKRFVHISCARSKQKIINQVKDVSAADVSGANTIVPQDSINQMKDMAAACKTCYKTRGTG